MPNGEAQTACPGLLVQVFLPNRIRLKAPDRPALLDERRNIFERRQVFGGLFEISPTDSPNLYGARGAYGDTMVAGYALVVRKGRYFGGGVLGFRKEP